MEEFFKWGNNCRILHFSIDDCLKVLYEEGSTVTKEQEDEFFQGFIYGQNDKVVSVKSGTGYN